MDVERICLRAAVCAEFSVLSACYILLHLSIGILCSQQMNDDADDNDLQMSQPLMACMF